MIFLRALFGKERNNIMEKYLKAHDQYYQLALQEIKAGQKQSHWMWYIFPQMKGLGRSARSDFYGIKDKKEAVEYMSHPVLRSHMLQLCRALLELDKCNIVSVFPFPDHLKLKSSMTLFATVFPEYDIFQKVLDKYYGGTMDEETLKLLEEK